MKNNITITKIVSAAILVLASLGAVCGVGGCGAGGFNGYNNGWPYTEDISTIYVEMFDSRSFRRGHEYELTDAICKRIEAQTPYKIVSDRDRADSVLGGQIVNIGQNILTYERNTGKTFEQEAHVLVEVTWQNLKNNTMLIDNETVEASVSYSEFLDQGFEYGSKVAVNRAAKKIVERMQLPY